MFKLLVISTIFMSLWIVDLPVINDINDINRYEDKITIKEIEYYEKMRNYYSKESIKLINNYSLESISLNKTT